MIADRIKELRRVKASSLIRNPKNWRTHPPAQQNVLRGLLAEVGYADALITRETPDGLMLVDGHLRAETTPDMEVPVLVTDLNEEEADKLLASLDPLAAMAEADGEKLDSLIESLDIQSAALKEMLDELKSGGAELVEVDVQPPPVMAWVLIGLPISKFGSIAADIERIAAIPDSIVETTANDGPKDR